MGTGENAPVLAVPDSLLQRIGSHGQRGFCGAHEDRRIDEPAGLGRAAEDWKMGAVK